MAKISKLRLCNSISSKKHLLKILFEKLYSKIIFQQIWRSHCRKRWGVAATGVNWKELFRERILTEKTTLPSGPTTLDFALGKFSERILKAKNTGFVTSEEGHELAAKHGLKFIEISSLSQYNIKEMYEMVLELIFTPPKLPSKKPNTVTRFFRKLF